MTQADVVLTDARDGAPTGFSSELSRRSLLSGALAAAPLVALPAVAASIESPAIQGASDMNMHTTFPQVLDRQLERTMADSRAAADAKFWAAHRHYRALEAAWEADPDNSDENSERHAGPVHEAFDVMMCCGVFSARAVLAKYLVTQGQFIYLPGPAENSIQMIESDLGRLAMLELEIE